MGATYTKDFHVVARHMWLADQMKVPPLDRREWLAASLAEKLSYEARAREFVGRQ